MKLLFIIGSSRSGTKIIRDILNNIDQVCITSVEMKIIPQLLNRFCGVNELTSRDLGLIYSKLEASTYALTMHGNNKKYPKSEFIDENSGNNIFSILKNYIAFYEEKDNNLIKVFGDKTPSYYKQLDIISKFRNNIELKIIYIIRDPRDVVLSFRNSWGKSIYRSAYKWNDSIRKIQSYNCNTITVKYEDLLEKSEETLEGILTYLGIKEEKLYKLFNYKSSEVFGSAKGYHGIKKDNTQKYLTHLDKQEIEQIENICFDNMVHYSYRPIIAINQKNPSKIKLRALFFYDNLKYIYHIIIKERGVSQGFLFLFKTYRRYFANMIK